MLSHIESDSIYAAIIDIFTHIPLGLRIMAAVSHLLPKLLRKRVSDVTGNWRWYCCGEQYWGKITLIQLGSKISGSFQDERTNVGGGITGSVEGNKVKFTRRWSKMKQHYTLALSPNGKTLRGDFQGPHDPRFGTEFSATRVNLPMAKKRTPP